MNQMDDDAVFIDTNILIYLCGCASIPVEFPAPQASPPMTQPSVVPIPSPPLMATPRPSHTRSPSFCFSSASCCTTKAQTTLAQLHLPYAAWNPDMNEVNLRLKTHLKLPSPDKVWMGKMSFAAPIRDMAGVSRTKAFFRLNHQEPHDSLWFIFK